MLMGFIGYGSTPPAPPPPDETPPDGAPDDTGIQIAAAARAATLRYRRERSKLSRYAWVISLGIHGLVVLAAFFAYKFYFRPLAPPKFIPDQANSDGIGSVITSSDATDLVHGGFGITLIPDGPLREDRAGMNDVPNFISGEPKTVATLSNLAAISGIDDLRISGGSIGFDASPNLPRRAAAATQPGGIAPR